MKYLLGIVLLTAAATAAEGPRIVYSKNRPGGYPSYVEITVERDGSGVWRDSAGDGGQPPVDFRLRPEEADEIFRLARELDFFRRPLESHLKVANLGLKTFRYEDGEKSYEQQFNFSRELNARLLADWFARITESVQHRLNLERTSRFDKLGVNKVLLQIQISMEKNRLVAADQFLPLLDKVAADESILNMARSRAARLASAIRAGGRKGK